MAEAQAEQGDGMAEGMKYPHAWRGDASRNQMSREQVDALQCSVEGCDLDWGSAGGLARLGGTGEWRCAKHRDVLDHGSHRLDLRMAHQRATNVAVTAERERIIRMLEDGTRTVVLDALYAQRRGAPAAAAPSEPTE